MNKLFLLLLLIVGLNCSAQIDIKPETDYTYKKGITDKAMIFCSGRDVVDTIRIYHGEVLMFTFVYTPCKKEHFRNLPVGKYYLISTNFNDSVIVNNIDKLFIKNEHFKCGL